MAIEALARTSRRRVTRRNTDSNITELSALRVKKDREERALAQALLEHMCHLHGFGVEDYIGSFEAMTVPDRNGIIRDVVETGLSFGIPEPKLIFALKISAEGFNRVKEKVAGLTS